MVNLFMAKTAALCFLGSTSQYRSSGSPVMSVLERRGGSVTGWVPLGVGLHGVCCRNFGSVAG